MSNEKFVFVVCGAREHIDTLHFSLPYLRHFSSKEIIVVTDSRRNEIPVDYDNVVDVETPAHFDNHQASIYLKVGLNKFLPKGFLYCYLDTDVIALSKECDDVFKHKQGPITFAADHCRLPKFSPSAVRCNCLVNNKKEIAELEALMDRFDPARKERDEEMELKKQHLIRQFEIIKRDKLKYMLITLRFLTAPYKFKLDDDTYYLRWKKVWVDKQGRIIIKPAESMVKDIEANSEWRWNTLKRRWFGPQGQDVYNLECHHLAEYIEQKFGIKVADKNFQHWNGGAFLFDDSSADFLNAWFDKTMKIFEDKNWYTRDQGTLIATVWQFGLQNNPLLPRQFNFIADYNNPALMMDENGGISDNAFQTVVHPALIHIYHNFGKRGWDIWEHVEKVGQQLPKHERA